MIVCQCYYRLFCVHGYCFFGLLMPSTVSCILNESRAGRGGICPLFALACPPLGYTENSILHVNQFNIKALMTQ